VQSLQDLGRDRGEGGELVGAQAVEDEPSYRVDVVGAACLMAARPVSVRMTKPRPEPVEPEALVLLKARVAAPVGDRGRDQGGVLAHADE
jgi:hypothetical protein